MSGRKTLSRREQIIAGALAAIWCGGGIAGFYAGVARSSRLAIAAGVAAVIYGLLWIRVAAGRKLL